MIRKVNVLLVVLFAALIGVKALKSLSASRAASSAGSPGAEARQVPSLAPNVYYFNWSDFSVENTMANRNGVLLDTLRAIFPDARFVHLRGAVSVFAKALREDPRAVVVGFGHHRDLKGVGVVSDLPLALSRLAVMTLRSNPWRYSGPESLAGLRIVSNDDFLDYPLVKRVVKVQESGETAGMPTINVVSDLKSREDIGRMVESGQADAFFVTCDSSSFMPEQFSSTIFQRFRMSGAIDSGEVLLRVSTLDASYSSALLEAYGKGMRRIDASGERARIFAYYGLEPPALPAE